MSNWTFEDLQNYTRKRLKDEARARAKRAQARSGYSVPVVLAWFKECGLPEPQVEYQFDLDRKWRFDFSWSAGIDGQVFVALEVQGGLFSGGAHVRGRALLKEHEKLNRAACLGWRVLFCTPQNLCSREMAETIRAALAI